MTEMQDTGVIPELSLGRRMRLALDHAGMTSIDMADYLEVHKGTLSRWLNDQSPVRRSMLRLWAFRTGVSLHWLETGMAPQPEPGGQMYAIRDSNPEPAGLQHLRLTEVAA